MRDFFNSNTCERKKPQANIWENIKRDCVERQFYIAKIVREKKFGVRKIHIKKYETGQSHD